MLFQSPRAVNLRSSLRRLSYFVPRNSQGSLPVYTDIRNGGTRVLTLIRNIEGADKLATDIKTDLAAENLQIQVKRSTQVVIHGRWKNQVVKWLLDKGF